MSGCIRCGRELWTIQDLETSICASCWVPEQDEPVKAFVAAVLNKDGPNAHPDNMFAMKYSDKFSH